ncbi:MAG: glycoside hydrolase family 15 protein [Armatimonadetes bacterium]|nr:glycoside hydrolase family 15 protein [Armatimonadota bacterium]
MPRSLAFGNQSLLIQTDSTGTIRDLYFPQVGLYNHVSGAKCRVGFWSEGKFCWLDGDGWTRNLGYESGVLVGHSELSHSELGIGIFLQEGVDPNEPIFLRRLVIRDLTGRDREVRVFFGHDLRIAESDIGDTAMYVPQLSAMVHFKREHYFLFGARGGHSEIFQYQTGFKEFKGIVGTWPDAEDGWLEMKPIEQGSVDSTYSVSLALSSMGKQEVEYWLGCGTSLEDLGRVRDLINSCPFAEHFEKQRRSWAGWTPEPAGLENLSPELQEFYRKSLQIVITQTDARGAILAANDSDILESNRATYCYCWPRDGALVAAVLARAGRMDMSGAYFEFCARVLPKDNPIFSQKYGPDGSVGATWHPYIWDGEPILPFQQDETSLTIWALAEHARLDPADPRLNQFYDDIVAPASRWMASYRDGNGLPLPSWDLWEERRGIHANTVAAVIAGYSAAARLARQLSRPEAEAAEWESIADSMLAAWQRVGFNSERGCFYRMLNSDGAGYVGDATVDSAVMAFQLLEVLPGSDPMLISSREAILKNLTVNSAAGGLARYEGDYYFRKSEAHAGNPWIICSMWQAQASCLAGDRAKAIEWLEWAMMKASATSILSEQYHSETGEPLSVSPLTWSHAEVLLTFLMVLEVG